MARKPGPGKCVHCCTHVDRRNWDHVFPESWYPSDTPNNLEKWKIPSCLPCNRNYGVLEQEMLLRLALCLDPRTGKNKGIIDRAMRSIDPSEAKSQGDRRARAAKRRQLQNEVMVGHQIPSKGIYPGLGERWYRPISERAAISVPASSFNRLCEKVVRGLTYIQDGTYIESPHKIGFYPLSSESAVPLEELLVKYGTVTSRGPGISVARAAAEEDRISSIWKISIFGELVMYAITSPEG